MTALRTRVTLVSLAFAVTACATQSQQQSGAASAQAYSGQSTSYPAQRQSVRPASSYGTDGDAMLLDVVFLRPVSLVGSAVGIATWIVSLPFSLPSRSAGEAWDALVQQPLDYTFTRPLGDISTCTGGNPGCSPTSW